MTRADRSGLITYQPMWPHCCLELNSESLRHRLQVGASHPPLACLPVLCVSGYRSEQVWCARNGGRKQTPLGKRGPTKGREGERETGRRRKTRERRTGRGDHDAAAPAPPESRNVDGVRGGGAAEETVRGHSHGRHHPRSPPRPRHRALHPR